MENLQNLNNVFDNIQMLWFFSPEILCLIAILINFAVFLFFKRKEKTKKISDISTLSAFLLGFLSLVGMYIKNRIIFYNFEFSIFNGNFLFNNHILLYKMSFNLFFALLILVTYKLNRKARFKVPILNSYLLVIALLCSLIFQVENAIFAFILLDLCVFMMYKFASNTRIRNEEIFSLEFISISLSASILFFLFYALLFFFKQSSQLAIMNVCISMAILLKAGLFPIYNYSQTRTYKNNITYSILLFCLLPYFGILVLSKFLANIDVENMTYLITLSAFVLTLILTSALGAFKIKNLVKYMAKSSISYYGIFVCFLLLYPDNLVYKKYMFIFVLFLLALYSQLCVLKLNLKAEKINFSSLCGLFIKNPMFCILLAILILTLSNVFPSMLLFDNLAMLNEIYAFDNIGFYLVFAIITANMLILCNGLFALKMCYTKTSVSIAAFSKKTAINYAVSLLIFIILVIKIYL